MDTRLILEFGCNHQGDFDTARRMIDAAAKLGVHGVKMQKHSPDDLPEDRKALKRDPATSFGDTFYAHRKALELPIEQVDRLRAHAEALGLMFMESVHDVRSFHEVRGIGIRHLKLPSQHFGHPELNRLMVAAKEQYGCFIARATGMHTTCEVLEDFWLHDYDVTLYCRSIYPHGIDDCDPGSAARIFDALTAAQRGYSSHDSDGLLVPLFVQMGATWVERHFTLDKTLKGSDHHTVSSDPAEVATLVERIREVEDQMRPRNMTALADVREQKTREFYVR
jgi:sialic acid synthase